MIFQRKNYSIFVYTFIFTERSFFNRQQVIYYPTQISELTFEIEIDK